MHAEKKEGPSSRMIDVFILDQNQFFRQGLGAALSHEQNIRVVGEAEAEENNCEIIRSVSPKVVLVGLTETPVSKIQMIHRLAKEIPGVALIALTSNFSENELIQVVAAGASAYSAKDIDANSLADTIRRVADGEFLIAEDLISEPSILTRMLKHFQVLLTTGGRPELTDSPITAREAEVLTYVACGYGNKQIARSLQLSEQTIKNHMVSIIRKLAVNDRTHAVVKAMQHGWITASIGDEQGSQLLSSEMVFE